MGNLGNGNAAVKDVAGEKVKGWSEMVTIWIWKMCNIAFKSGIVPED